MKKLSAFAFVLLLASQAQALSSVRIPFGYPDDTTANEKGLEMCAALGKYQCECNIDDIVRSGSDENASTYYPVLAVSCKIRVVTVTDPEELKSDDLVWREAAGRNYKAIFIINKKPATQEE